MTLPVDLLLITWNRREYIEKTLAHLFKSASDFRLYCWDNGSKDGTADLIASLADPRVVVKHFSKENLNQRAPSLWFLEKAKSDVVGKIDDDILLPDGWIERIAPMLRSDPRLGMLGCWIYMPEDWDESVAEHKIVEVGGELIFRNAWIAGQSFLARRETLRRHVIPAEAYSYGLPIDQSLMTGRGLINGYPLPILFGHNMDDPRSPYCLMNRPGGMGAAAALTARRRGFKTAKAYGDWIAADAAKLLREPLEEQLMMLQDRRLFGSIRTKIAIRRRLVSMLGLLSPETSSVRPLSTGFRHYVH